MNWDLPPKPTVRMTINGLVRGSVAALLILLLGVTGLAPAQADELDDRQRELQGEIARQSEVIGQAQAQRDAAAEAARQARSQLADAEARLAQAEAEVQAAEDVDRQRAAELAEAEAKLEAADEALRKADKDLRLARAEVAAAKAALDSVNRRLNVEILVTTQHRTGLVNLALIFTDVDASNLNQRTQLAQTLMSSSAAQLDELEMRRLALEDAEVRADEAQKAADEAQKAADAAHDEAEAARQAAADQLAAKQYAQGQAEALRTEVANLVIARDQAEAQANEQVAQEQRRQQALEDENRAVERRIQERIAAEKKAAAEKAAREAEARRKAEADRKAAAERKAEADRIARAAKASKPAAKPAPAPAATSKPRAEAPAPSRSSSRSAFIRPVQGRLTSKYGMRLHPVTGIYKLHDGTDFGAACGTPIRAAAAGVVTERYYNAGYGHRLMIDHGKVNGTYVTTGYNHATHYVVGVGTRVKQGQTVGYVGSTGYSTGCHLHLMVWENGRVVNPMARWFS